MHKEVKLGTHFFQFFQYSENLPRGLDMRNRVPTAGFGIPFPHCTEVKGVCSATIEQRLQMLITSRPS